MATKAETYSPGAHTGAVRALHDARRTELLARDEVLASEIAAAQAERDDINEALRLMSPPVEAEIVAMAAE
ncbi:hypothetical protein ACFOOL_15020 [Devosia honganensis]|uniref:Uncharacterized protein n=1 Tax=Devosia honganensis TaxID=1610527 RepID=A0ABV7X625_9HYPH|nr:hypothetical protein [Devosia sp.]